jgi:hypothetical protein
MPLVEVETSLPVPALKSGEVEKHPYLLVLTLTGGFNIHI